MDIPFQQPVPFSHKHHVSDDGIDCRYCHTSVEKSSFAGLPPTETCMTCHSQIWTDSPMLAPVRASFATNTPLKWNRVHDLPGYVYFNHSIHVAKGIGCSTCHGRVDQMPLTRKTETLYMKWCLDCHRNPQKYIRPRDKIYDMAWQPARRSAGRRTKTRRPIPCRYQRTPGKLQHLSSMNESGYWRSLKELSARGAIDEQDLNEFFPGASEWPEGWSRRDFVRLLGASLALAGFSSCTKQPIEKIVPYVKQPEEVVPG